MIAVFLFYDKTHGIFNNLAFSKDLKHCNVIMYNGIDYLLTTIDKTGTSTKIVNITKLDQFLRVIKFTIPSLSSIICAHVEKRENKIWFPLAINSCNEVARKISGISLRPTINVQDLYAQIMKHDDTKNYKIDYEWRRKNGRQ